MIAQLEQRLKSPSILALGTLSGLACFALFWTSFQLATRLARTLSNQSGTWPGALVGEIEPVKWIGGSLVVIVALLVTYTWDRLRVRYRLDVVQYWTMIGVALSICSLVALLSGGF